MPLPAIGLISHGTSSSEGQAVIEDLAAAISEDLQARGLADEVMLGHVDVQQPDVAEVLSSLAHERPMILVPLLLSPGYHVHVDLAEAVREAGGAGGPRGADEDGVRNIRLTATLGPDPRLAQVLAERLPTLEDGDHVVLAAAGSSDERANVACLDMAESLARELSRPVTVGFHAGEGNRLGDIVEQKRELGGRVVVSNYLLAPGFFHDLAGAIIAGTGDLLAPPLLHNGAKTPSLLVDIVRDRIVSVL